MKTIRTSLIPLTIAGMLGFAAGIACLLFLNADAGDLEPTDPPGPTMKTLDEVEPRIPITSAPYIISESGSYYFTGDLTSPIFGILVSADNVTIDLMGHTLAYDGTGSAHGVYMDGRNNVEIRNGTVRDFAGIGIYEHGISSKGHRIIDIRVVSNGSYGILLSGYGHLVKDCHSTGNSDTGISAGKGSTISGNVCYGNGFQGISAGFSCTVSGNTCRENGSNGIGASNSCTVSGNTCFDNGNDGIWTGVGNTISGNTCFANDADGIDAGTGSNVLGNTSRVNENWGIYLDGDNFVAQNSATNNNISGGAYGNMNTSDTSTYGLNHRP